jgi:CheY-like chemotaxis protein
MARILLIDDDDPFRTMLSQTLEHFGHAVVQACNGEEGLRLLAQAHPDLVITDIVMPEKEGVEVLMELRESLPPMKIIVISGGGRGKDADYLGIAKLLGASAVLAKPFSTDALLDTIEQVLPSAAACTGPPA